MSSSALKAPASLPELGAARFDRRRVVLDTDVFYDPDDIVNLILAARLVQSLVVVTSDEVRGWRARGARAVLDSLGRTDVPVIEGIDLHSDRFMLDRKICADFPPVAPINLIDGITSICNSTSDRVLWVGCGSLTNLAEVITAAPELTDQLQVVQMGGWIDPKRYRDPSRTSHNFRIDPRAAGLALRMFPDLRLVLSEHTGVPQMLITGDSPLYQRLAAPGMPEWAALAASNFDAWFERRLGGSWMHDPLTLAAALGAPTITFRHERLHIAPDARLYRDLHGRDIEVTDTVDYDPIEAWIQTATCPQFLAEKGYS